MTKTSEEVVFWILNLIIGAYLLFGICYLEFNIQVIQTLKNPLSTKKCAKRVGIL